MTIDDQISQLRAADKLQDFPDLAKIAAASDKAAAAIAQINAERARAESEEAERMRVHEFPLTLEPHAATDVAVVTLDRAPAFQVYTTPDGQRVRPRVSGSVSFGPSWLAQAIDALPAYNRDGWFWCTPAQAIDLFSFYFARAMFGIVDSGRDNVRIVGIEQRRSDEFALTVRLIQSTALLLCMWRRLSMPGARADVVAAARVVRSALVQQGYDPAASVGLPSELPGRQAVEAAASRIWNMCMSDVGLPALPQDLTTLQRQRTTETLIASQAASQARLNGGAA